MPDLMRKKILEVAETIKKMIPSGFGFFVIVFPFGDSKGRANYTSNAKREDIIKCMKEFLIQSGHEEDWMKHIK